MCKFMSAIVTRNGDIFQYPETDSHEAIIAAHGFRDDGAPLASRSWVRVEFTPPADVKEIADEAKWTLNVDEVGLPDWWEEKRAAIRSDLWARIKRMMINDERECLIGGSWIILSGAKIRRMIGSRIVLVAKDADLSGAYLRNASLSGASLSGANLTYANLSDASLRNADLSGANLRNADLSGAHLWGADLRNADLWGADLSGADLSGARRYATDAVPEGWKLEKGILVKM